MATYYTTDIVANGTPISVPVKAVHGGTTTDIYRLIGNGVDYIHKFTEVTETATINLNSYATQSGYEGLGGRVFLQFYSNGNCAVSVTNITSNFDITITGATIVNYGSSYIEQYGAVNFPEGSISSKTSTLAITQASTSFNLASSRGTASPCSTYSNRFAYIYRNLHLVNFKIQFPSGTIKTLNEVLNYSQGNETTVSSKTNQFLNIRNSSKSFTFTNTYTVQEY